MNIAFNVVATMLHKIKTLDSGLKNILIQKRIVDRFKQKSLKECVEF